jgi:hypothetical protein
MTFYSAHTLAEDLGLLNTLESKYQLSDPTNNKTGTDKIVTHIANVKANNQQTGRDIEYELLKRHSENKIVYKPKVAGVCRTGFVVNDRAYCEKDRPPKAPRERLDFSRHGVVVADMPTKLKDSYDDAYLLTKDVSVPTSSGTGTLNVPISQDKVKLIRDADGNLVTEVNPTPTYYTHEISNSDLVSSEVNHGDTHFDANEAYGDEDDLITKGRSAIASEKVAPTSLGLAYRTILKSHEDNPPTTIHQRDPLLDAGFNEVLLAEKGEGEWGDTCDEEETTTESTAHFPKWEVQHCTEPKRDNPQSCQVDLELNLPVEFTVVKGDLPAERRISYVDDKTLRIEISSSDNTVIDARSYNDDYESVSPFGFRQCRVYWSKYVLTIKDDIKVVGLKRTGGAVDDTVKEFVNGQLSDYMREGTYNHINFWNNANEGTLPFPIEYYDNWPADAKMLYESGQMTSGFPSCERGGGTIPNKDLTSFLTATDNTNEIVIEFLVGIGGSGEVNLTYDIEFEESIAPELIYHQSPEGCGDLIGWYPPNEIPAGVCKPQCEIYTSTGGIGPIGSGCTATCEVQSQIKKGMCKANLWQSAVVGTQGYDASILAYVPPMFRGDNSTVTWKGNAQGFMCDPLGGDPLAVDINTNGTIEDDEYFTYEQIRTQPNQCEEFQTSSLCTSREVICEEGWMDDESGICYMKRKTYDCDVGETITTTNTQLSNTCAGLLPCTNGECELKEEETTDQFVNAMVQLNIAQHMESDYSCADGDDPSTCRIFTGKGGFCTWEQSGLGNDCCEVPGGTSVLEYAMMANDAMNHVQNANITLPDSVTSSVKYVKAGYEKFTGTIGEHYESASKTLSDGSTATYNYLKETPVGEAASSAYDYVTTSITDVASSISGNVTKDVAIDAGTGSLKEVGINGATGEAATDGIMAEMQQEMLNKVANALPEGLRDALFDAVGDEAASTAATEAAKEAATDAGTDYVVDEGIANIAGAVMGAYMAYTYIKLALSLYSSCHEVDLATAVQIKQSQCISIAGSYHPDWDVLHDIKRQDYCCYNSMLARIIMEQASPLLGHNLELYSAEVEDDSTLRSCPGLTAAQLAGLDWSQIDLTEWIDTMIGSGIMPSDTSENALTKDGSLNMGSRDTATQRNVERMEAAGENGWADRAIEADKYLNADNIDCSYLPRPVVCDYNEP